MWLSGISIGADGTVIDDGSISAAPVAPPADTSSPLIRLAADLADAIHPYKTGVPVNLQISPQTQSFLIMGGVLIAGVVLLGMFRK
jgi:hypothetical protein